MSKMNNVLVEWSK